MDDEDFGLNNLWGYFDNLNNLSNWKLLNSLKRGVKHRKKYRVRERINPMIDYDRDEFKQRFRFYKDEVEYIYNLIDGSNTLHPAVRIFYVYIQILKQ